MESYMQVALTSISAMLASVVASSGFWAYMQNRDTTKAATTRLLMGMAYERIMELGVAYIERGWLTTSEFEEYQKYYCQPYKALGGNGVAENVMNRVAKLPLTSDNHYAESFWRSANPEEEPTNA